MTISQPRQTSASRGMSSLRSRGVVVIVTLLLLTLASSVLTSSSSLRAQAARAISHTPLVGVIDAPQASSGCGKSPSIIPGTTEVGSIISSGTVRMYLAHLPFGYLPTQHYPLVLNFHGHDSTAAHQERITGFSDIADRENFIVAYPQGIIGPDLKTGWSSGGPNKPRINDVLFVSDLLNTLQHDFCIDPARIYATGFSNGGGLTSVLACRLSGRIAAFASVSGSYFTPDGGCLPDRPVSFLEFHGTSDAIVPYDGNPRTHLIGAMEWMQTWATRDNCLDEDSTSLLDGVTEFTWTDCQGGAEVIHYRIPDGTHVWPGNPMLTLHAAPGDITLDASSLIWSFFATHSLTEPSSAA